MGDGAGLFVAKIESNVKARGARTFDLGSKTLLIGPNGSGKTALLQGIELALTARASDRGGDGALSREVDLLALAPRREGPLSATATLSDGRTVAITIEGSTARAHRPVRTGDVALLASLTWEGAFPARGAIAALDGSADALRRHVLALLALTTPQSEVDGAIEGCPRPGDGQTPIDAMLAWRDSLVAQKRKAEDALKAATAEAAGETEGAAAMDKARQTAQDREAAQARIEAAQLRIAAADQRIALIKDKIVAIAGERDVRVKAVGPTAQTGEALLEVLHTVVARTAKKAAETGERVACPACGAPADPQQLADRRETLHVNLLSLRKVREDRSVAAQTVAVEFQQRLDKGNRLHSETLAEKAAAQGEMDAARGEIAALDRFAVRDAKAAAERLSAAKAAAKAAARAVEDVNAAIETVLMRAESGLGEKLREGYGIDRNDGAPAVVLRDGKREVCQVGIRRAGVLLTELSGAEWARLVGAFAGLKRSDSPVRIIATPDKAFDPASLGLALPALGRLVERGTCTQVIVQSVVEPDAIPADWTVVRLGGGAVIAPAAPVVRAVPPPQPLGADDADALAAGLILDMDKATDMKTLGRMGGRVEGARISLGVAYSRVLTHYQQRFVALNPK